MSGDRPRSRHHLLASCRTAKCSIIVLTIGHCGLAIAVTYARNEEITMQFIRVEHIYCLCESGCCSIYKKIFATDMHRTIDSRIHCRLFAPILTPRIAILCFPLLRGKKWFLRMKFAMCFAFDDIIRTFQLANRNIQIYFDCAPISLGFAQPPISQTARNPNRENSFENAWKMRCSDNYSNLHLESNNQIQRILRNSPLNGMYLISHNIISKYKSDSWPNHISCQVSTCFHLFRHCGIFLKSLADIVIAQSNIYNNVLIGVSW